MYDTHWGIRSETSNPLDRLVRLARLHEHDPIAQYRLIDLASFHTNGNPFVISDVNDQVAPILRWIPSRWFEVLTNHQTGESLRHPHPSFIHPVHIHPSTGQP